MKLVSSIAIFLLIFISCNSSSSTCSKYEGSWNGPEISLTITSNGTDYLVKIKEMNIGGDYKGKCEKDELLINGNWIAAYDNQTGEILFLGKRLNK